MKLPNTVATHLATLNLFREHNGDVKMTVVEAKGAISELDTRGRLTVATPHDYVLALAKAALAPKYAEACDRILDMLRQDDGQAFFEAEKFLKANAPDLYNKLGREVL